MKRGAQVSRGNPKDDSSDHTIAERCYDDVCWLIIRPWNDMVIRIDCNRSEGDETPCGALRMLHQTVTFRISTGSGEMQT